MNKKLFLGMFAAAGMLLATSCSNDELDVVQSGNEAQVTFSLGLEGGIATRAISDGTKADKLVYAVYKLNAQGEPELQPITGSDNNKQFVKDDAFSNGLTETVSVSLAKGQTYQVAFWAQSDDCNAYDTDDLRAVKVDYDGDNNDESRDAFFKMVEFSVEGNKVIDDIILKRPFAQINVGVYQKDWTDAVNSGIEISTSKVTIAKAANKIDLLTGTVDGEETVEYNFATIPAQLNPEEVLFVDIDKDGEKEKYKYLSMSYILANDETTGYEKTSLESLNFEFAPKVGNNIKLKDGLNAVPVRRNWRTNIIGTILTGDVQLNVTIEPGYYDDYNPMDQLKEVLQNGGKITLFSDATLSESFTIPAGKNVEIDLNGNTLNVETQYTVEGNLSIGNGTIQTNVSGQGDLFSVFVAKKGSTIDFNDANVIVADKNAAVTVLGDDVTVNLNKTTMNGYHGIFAYPSAFGHNWYKNLKITLTESTITGSPALYLMYVDATVILDDKSSAKVFGVSGGDTKVNVVYSGEKPEVQGDGTANSVIYYTTDEYLFKEALANGETMTLNDDLILTKGFAIDAGKKATIDLNSNLLDVNKTVTVKGELNISNGNIVNDMSGRSNAFALYGADAKVNLNKVEMTVEGNNNGITIEPSQTNPNAAAVINLDDTDINVTGGNGHAIFVVQYVKDLKINVTNGSQITGNQAIFIEKADNAVIYIDKTSSVSNVIALYGNVTIICEEGATAPTTTGSANFTVYGSQAELEISETFANGGTTTLTDDVTLSSGMTVAAGATAEIALDNNTLTVASQTTVLGDLTISGGEVAVNVPRNGNATMMGFLADNGSEINVKDATINVAKSNMAFAIFNEGYAYHDIETTINIENSTISGEGRGIVSPFGAKSVNINLTNSSIHEIYLKDVAQAVITVDATSTANKIAIEGNTKLTVKHPAGNKPDVSGNAANVTFVEI